MKRAQRYDGRLAAQKVLDALEASLAALRDAGITPGLAVVLVGEDPASEIYVKSKIAKCQAIGIESRLIRMPKDVSEAKLISCIDQLNADPAISGILVQMPLPAHIDASHVLTTISAAKDVDGFHPDNVAKLVLGQPGLRPCTPSACIYLLKEAVPSLAGKHAVVIGRSNIVGKPVAAMLLNEHCSVTIVHSRSDRIEAICAQADIVIAAVGKPRMVRASWIKPGAIVVDVGINRIREGDADCIVGDVDQASIEVLASFITPVPGGVGPMTVAFLMRNTVKAAFMTAGLTHSSDLD
ncbi:bifunctional 5,10-methylenetetrahydrofolate dehydrogenase/5,10-methenyltetrahydrofolate cyclohydrolase [Burkholderia anthina]|uniref:bifunctional 5,10-methylenetetrahydrofolate dehydrogenase/5,10-methenyltetrahydrofolate cyclohydrolase n=1 Tax=Burkholderia anthina TaxID=179879 RepID=UPI001AA08019|nr:bifunctional 5,10-methylenetetrahydrofolate dehydrogenase/5,10-methenyltetrahydrofolate cyclohydrolase [Burkholderia anthina]QTD94920.1 bifunctional 5,10-methylenetetrahydrofolate dehydrogenase/5,10-methenyltetrahydrofolate cyclohydrolase [Burkholderia anthina]